MVLGHILVDSIRLLVDCYPSYLTHTLVKYLQVTEPLQVNRLCTCYRDFHRISQHCLLEIMGIYIEATELS